MSTTRFTPERRERFLTLLEAGWTGEAAAAAARVSRQTVNRWANRGRSADARADHAEFAERYDAAKLGPDERPLSEEETVKLIERAARKGSVGAMKMMLDHHRRHMGAASFEDADPFSALEGDRVAQQRAKRR